MHTLASATVQESGNRPTLVFTPGVASAESLALMLQDRYHKTARAVSGKTNEDERRAMMDDFREGKFNYFISCGVLLEGVDLPNASCLICARPTKSRLLKAQMVGRILRGGWRCPVPGKTDNALIVDLVASSAKHKLCHCADLLGGKYDEVVVEAANKACFGMGWGEGAIPVDVLEQVSRAVANIDELQREKRKNIIAEAKLKRKTIDPFTVLANDLDLSTVEQEPGWWQAWPATPEQVSQLEKQGIKAEKSLTEAEARTILRSLENRRKSGACTYKQAKMLRSRSLDPGMTFEQAGAVMRHFATRPGGYAFTPEDGIAKARAKKLGRYLAYTDLNWAPIYTVRKGTKAVDRNQNRVDLTGEVYLRSVARVDGDKVQFPWNQQVVQVAASDVLNLKTSKWLAEKKQRAEEREHAF